MRLDRSDLVSKLLRLHNIQTFHSAVISCGVEEPSASLRAGPAWLAARNSRSLDCGSPSARDDSVSMFRKPQ